MRHLFECIVLVAGLASGFLAGLFSQRLGLLFKTVGRWWFARIVAVFAQRPVEGGYLGSQNPNLGNKRLDSGKKRQDQAVFLTMCECGQVRKRLVKRLTASDVLALERLQLFNSIWLNRHTCFRLNFREARFGRLAIPP